MLIFLGGVMFKTLVIIAALIASMTANVIAADKIPREDFIKYTDGCIDVLDELEMAYSKFEITKNEANKLNDKLDLCIKKYSRYGDYKKWDENSLQYKIVGKFHLVNFRISFSMLQFEAGQGDYKELRKTISENNEIIKDKFLKYKETVKRTSFHSSLSSSRG